MQGQEALFASGSEMWATPDDFFAALDVAYGPFDLDAAASPENAKCARYFTEADDGLAQVWTGHVFCNPPFNRKRKMYVEPWVKKAFRSVVHDRTAKSATLLLPSRTDTHWFHNWVLSGASQVLFVPGRLRFVQAGKKNAAPFPSLVVRWEQDHQGAPVFGEFRPSEWAWEEA
jgi:site-specific DNA-methyltransferase (adenine-specific)